VVLWTLLIVVVVLLFVVYFKGVKAGAGWGKPVAALLALVLVGLAVATIVTVRRRPTGGMGRGWTRMQASARDSARAIAAELKDRLGASPRLFVMGVVPIGSSGSGTRSGAAWRSWNEGLKEGFGGEIWQIVGYYGPVRRASAEDVNGALASVQGEIDGVISFDGLPADAQALSIYGLAKPPVVGVYFRSGATPEQVRTLLADGLVQVAVMVEEGQVKVFTPQAPP